MNRDCLKLTTYFGERDRANGGFLADALLDLYERERFETSVLLRGVEGFGLKHHVQTDRLLTLSEDLPVVSVAVDTRERIERSLDDVLALANHGLVTLERARLVSCSVEPFALPEELGEAAKLTIYVGRQRQVAGRPGYLAIVDLLHAHGVEGATTLLGVDGTSHGRRRRARFFAANDEVPLMIIAVGAGARIAAALEELGGLMPDLLATLERVRVLKRDGRNLAEPADLPGVDSSGLGVWQKLMVYAGEQATHAGRPLSPQLVRRLREAGALGATTLRGVWGYHGHHAPHGDRFWALRRRVPVVTVIVDSPGRTREWFKIVDELTDNTGLVTSELVPAFRARGPDSARGGLRLASPGA